MLKSTPGDKSKTIEWRTVRLGDVATVKSGYAFKSDDWLDDGIPVIKITNVKDGRIVLEGCSYVSSDVANKAKEFQLQRDDILIAMTGYVGDVAVVRNEPDMVLNQRVGKFFIQRPDLLDPQFLFYFLRNPLTKNEIENLGYGSAQANVSPTLIQGIEMQLPSLVEQRSIASILGSLDDKIELNRQMNETLEQMAQTLFKSWFVDFEFPSPLPQSPLPLCPLPPKGGFEERGSDERGFETETPFRGQGARDGHGTPRVLDAASKKLYALLEEKAKSMRLHPTVAEAVLWERVRHNALGVKFRRQHVIDQFIVDFYCVEKGLVIELDGGIHDLQKEQDEERETVLKNLGCRALRFSNEQVIDDIESVLTEIRRTIGAPKFPKGDFRENATGDFERGFGIRTPFRGQGASLGYKSSGGAMENSALGGIPRGWKAGLLRDVVGFMGGYAFKSQDWIESGIPVVKIGSVKPGVVDLTQVSFVSEQVAQEARSHRLKIGDLLIGMTGYVGEVGLVPPTEDLPLLNQRVGKFLLEKAGTEELPFVYCLTRKQEFKTAVEGRSHGTAQANVSANGILSVPIIIPVKSIRDAFNQICSPMIDQLLNNHGENFSLEKIRDSLLPKLLSGEIRPESHAQASEI